MAVGNARAHVYFEFYSYFFMVYERRTRDRPNSKVDGRKHAFPKHAARSNYEVDTKQKYVARNVFTDSKKIAVFSHAVIIY